jgi:hypothetical protein
VPGATRTAVAGVRPWQAMTGAAVLLVGAGMGVYAGFRLHGGSRPARAPTPSGPTLASAPSVGITHPGVTSAAISPSAAAGGTRASVPPDVHGAGSTRRTAAAGAARTPSTVPVTTTSTTATPTTTAAAQTTTTAAPQTTEPAKPAPASRRKPAAKPATIALAAGAVTVYNPDSAAPTSFGDPGAVTAGSAATAWTYRLDPSTAGSVRLGLVIHLPSPRIVRLITLRTDTPGMSVEFYGTTGAPPSTITSSSWIRLANRPSIEASATVGVKTRDALANVLVWITKAPPEVTIGKIDIAKLALSG